MNAPKKPKAPPRNQKREPFWVDELEWTSERQPRLRATLMNAVLVLTHDDGWDGAIAWNQHAQRIEKLLPPPCPKALEPEGGTRVGVFDEDDAVRTAAWFESHPEYRVRYSEDLIYKAARVVALRRSFHPLRGELERAAQEWDGVARLDTWLSELLGAHDTPYTRLAGRFFLLGAVARAFEPGKKVDTVLILESEQGTGKSSAAEILFSTRYFTGTPIDLSSKDAYLAIRAKWGVELAELDSLSKAEQTRIKAFFSQKIDQYREPYARTMIEVPRSCVFIGTTNLQRYLRDETGARRFMPVTIESTHPADLVALAALRLQLWGEAVRIFKSGKARWWPEGAEEKALFAAETDDRFAEDPWHEPITQWLHDAIHPPTGAPLDRITTHAILTGPIKKETSSITRADEMRVGAILHALGWKSYRPRTDNPQRKRFYVPPGSELLAVVQPVQPGPTSVQPTESETVAAPFAPVQPVQPRGEFPSRARTIADAHEERLDRLDQKGEKNGVRARAIQANDNNSTNESEESLVLLQRFLSEACAVGGSETLRAFGEAFGLWATSKGLQPPPNGLLPSLLSALDVPVREDRVRGLHILDDRAAPLGGARGNA